MSKSEKKYNIAGLKKSAVFASIFVAIALSAIKLFAAIYTDSLAITSSFVDSLTDVISSLITAGAVYIALKPANCNHRYGFGKTEAVSAVIQAVFIAVSAGYVMFDGIKRIITPVEIKQTDFGIMIMLISIFLSLLLIAYQKYVAKKTGSLAISADSAHYLSDLATNSAVICSLIAEKYWNSPWFDLSAALFVIVYLLYQAINLGKQAFDMLTDHELDESIRTQISKLIMQTYGVMGFHDFRTRDLGGKYFFELHIEVDGNISLYQAHEIADNIEQNILKMYPDAQIIIHEDPFGIEENRLDNTLPEMCQKV